MAQYTYPINYAWSVEEMDTVIRMWTSLEAAYESNVNREELLENYRAFKGIVTSKMEEKQLAKQFEDSTGYSLYRTIQAAKASDKKTLTMS